MYLAQFVMGAALARQQQYPQAIEYLRRAIELQPDSTWAHYEMGSSLLKTGDYKTAVIHLEIASSRLPEFAEAHALLAQAYEHLGPGRRREARALKIGRSVRAPKAACMSSRAARSCVLDNTHRNNVYHISRLISRLMSYTIFR